MTSPETRALLVAQHTVHYAGLLRTHLALKDFPAALATVERARARSFVELLNERQIDFGSDAPADLLEKQDSLEWKRSFAYNQLAKLDPDKDVERAEMLRTELTKYAVQQRELEAQIRRISPKYAALQYPQPLDLKGIQGALDEGTLLLTYYIAEKETYLFAVGGMQGGNEDTEEGDGLHVFRIEIKADDLRGKVRAFRAAIVKKSDVKQLGEELYGLLVKPANGLVERAQRVLICPDGALNMLPFAALVVEGEKGGMIRYFADIKPLHTIVSMSVYAEIRRNAPKTSLESPTQVRLLAFGDPEYAGIKEDAKVRGFPLAPLPRTREEVECIARLYGGQAKTLLGKGATETVAKQQCGTARLLHFACHGLLDNHDPLRSGLLLTPTQGENGDDGLLQASEIFEQVRLDADLVVLSACETGLGKTTKNEGIIGLTRAFQYAGARSVVASLWQVSDESTAVLMEAFYSELQQGKPKDVALQSAMAQLRTTKGQQSNVTRGGPIRVPSRDYTHPYYWAPFVLIGDWK